MRERGPESLRAKEAKGAAMAVRRLGSALIFASAIVALGSASSLSGQNRPERHELPPAPQKDASENADFDAAPSGPEAFAAAMLRLNGDIFWAPAAASSNIITRFGDEARSVFGPIPPADCAADDARVAAHCLRP